MNFLLLAQLEMPKVAGEDKELFFSNLAPPLQVAILIGALSFASAALVSVTACTRIIIVLSFVRRALSTQEIPPNPVMLGLSLFLTMFVMAPTFEAIHKKALVPLLEASTQEDDLQGDEVSSSAGNSVAALSLTGLPLENAPKPGVHLASAALRGNVPGAIGSRHGAATKEKFGFEEAWTITSRELKSFMMKNTRTSDLKLFFDLSKTDVPYERMDPPLRILIPSFIISELKTAFIMGFCIYIPFLLIDLVVSTILMALGMMMMPPVVVSTPCKLLLFVMVDGWQLVAKALVSSFAGA